MMKTLRSLLCLSLMLGLIVTAEAQNAIPACGNNASGSGGSVSYSYGQVVYSAVPGTNGSELQGVQQPYEISIITAIEESEGICLTTTVYPNPAQTYLVLSVDGNIGWDLSYRLAAADGKLIQTSRIQDSKTTLNFESLSTGLYFLRVLDGRREVKTFKIIKN